MRTNLCANPSFEVASGTVNVRTNLVTNPSFEATSGTTNVRINLFTAGSMETFPANWGTPNSGTLTLTKETSGSVGAYGRATITGNTTNPRIDHYTNFTVSPNTVYTMSAFARTSATGRSFGFEIVEKTGSTVVGTTSSSNATLTANSWLRHSYTFTTGATTDNINIRSSCMGSAVAGDTFDIDSAMLEQSSVLGLYFDGGDAIQNLIGNPSFETDVSGWAVSTFGTRDTSKAYVGTSCLKVDASSSAAYSGVAITPSLTAGQTYTWSAYIWAPTGTSVNFAADGLGANTTLVGNSAWKRVSVTGTSVGGVFYIRSLAANQSPFWVDAVLLERSSSLNPYYAGTGDFTYVWSGTANASTSYQQAPAVSGWNTESNITLYRSPANAYTGSFSGVVIKKTATGTQSGISCTASTTIGASYTIQARVKALTGTPVVSFTNTVTGGTSLTTDSTWQLYSYTFTATTTTATLAFVATGSVGDSYAIDAVCFENAPSVLPYFDGSAPITNLVSNPSFETDTSGWGTYLCNISRDTTEFHSGVASLKVVTTGGGGPSYSTPIPDVPGNTHTQSMWVKAPSGQAMNLQMLQYDSASTNVKSTTVAFTATGVWQRVSVTDTIVSSAVRAQPYIWTSTGITFWIDDVLVERSTTLNQYYSGLGDFTYVWSGAANSSTSYQQAPTFSGSWTAAASTTIYQSILDPKVGTKSLAVLTTGGNGNGSYPADVFVNAGTTYTFSSWVRISSAQKLWGVLRYKDNSNNSVAADIQVEVTPSLVIGSWVRVSVSGLAPAGATRLQPMWRILEAHTATTFYVDGALVTDSPVDVPYFDGSTAASGDFTYTWAGTAHASASYQRAVGVASWGTLNATAVSSTDWSANGTKSIRVIATGSSADSFAFLTSGPLAAKTYTMLATCRVLSPQTGTLDGRARRLQHYFTGTGPSASTQAPNVAGTYPLSVTFTITDPNTYQNFRLYNGASAGGGDIWWDNVMLVEGVYSGDYIDGTKPFSKWDGVAHASTSVGYPPQLRDFAGKPAVDLIDAAPNASTSIPDGPITVYSVQSLGLTTGNPGYWEISTGGTWSSGTGVARAIGNTSTQGRVDAMRSNGTTYNNAITINPMTLGVLAVALDSANTGVDMHANGVPQTSTPVDTLFRTPASSTLRVGVRDGGITGTPLTKRLLVYSGKHDAVTRLAISRYLGNKYGANVA